MSHSDKKSTRTIDPNKPKIRIPGGPAYVAVKEIVEKHKLHTICQSGNCPNMAECWQAGTATFMILGGICTRGCRFCSVTHGKPLLPDPQEPEKLAETVRQMKLKHCVVTSVDRDDLPDYGAGHWIKTVQAIRKTNPLTTIEILVPDFKGDPKLLDAIAGTRPDIISHNLETVERLSPLVRPAASYTLSLSVLKHFNSHKLIVKSGIMMGLGESIEETEKTIHDIYNHGCRILTIGQYLQADHTCVPVEKYYSDDEFISLYNTALRIGFSKVESGKLVRSSYHSENHVV